MELSYLLNSEHDDVGVLARADARIEVDDVLVHHADAAGRSSRADRIPLRRAVDAEQRVLAFVVEEIHGAGAERIANAGLLALLDIFGVFRLALGHFRRRMPGRPFLLPGDVGV